MEQWIRRFLLTLMMLVPTVVYAQVGGQPTSGGSIVIPPGGGGGAAWDGGAFTNPALAPDGTCGGVSPSYSFSSDTDTGLTWISSGNIRYCFNATAGPQFNGRTFGNTGGGVLDMIIFSNGGELQWTGRSQIASPADSVLTLTNDAGTAFDRLQLGGTSSSFPAIQRNSAALRFRLADDSANADIEAADATFDTVTTTGSPSNSTFNGTINFCVDAGSNDTYACSLSPALTAYTVGACYTFDANTANTGAATINFNSLGATTIKKAEGGITTDLANNDIRAGQWVIVIFDGTNMQMMSPLGN